jgi:hypothetical protein
MTGHGAKLGRRREDAIAALLTQPTVKAAAAQAGVNEKTLRAWLKQPAFRAQYQAARLAVLEGCVAQLLAAGADAVAKLRELLKSRNPHAAARAAIAILAAGAKGVEVMDLEARLAALEAHDEGRERP